MLLQPLATEHTLSISQYEQLVFRSIAVLLLHNLVS